MQIGEIYARTFDESSGKQSANGCPECGGRVTTTSHETVCDDCGLVLSAQAVDRGSEWRMFESDDTEEDPRRTGAPLTPTRHDDGLSTEIGEPVNGAGSGPSARKRRRMGRLRQQHRRTKCRSKRERNQMEGLFAVNRMASALGLSKPIEERASVLFRSAHDAGLLPGRSIEAMATASLYAACRCSSDTARLLADFVRVSRVDESRIANAYDVLNRELGLPTPPPSPEAYLPQFASELDLDPAVERRARRVLDVAEAHDLDNGRNPAGVAAACLLVAAREVGCPRRLTQAAFADVADVSPVTLRSRRDELLAARSEFA